MKLLSLLEHLEYKCLQGSTDQEVSSVVYDSRKVEEGSRFICIRGAVVDGHKFVPDVVAKGARTLIVEEPVEAPSDVTVIQVKDTRLLYGRVFTLVDLIKHGGISGRLDVVCDVHIIRGLKIDQP